ncbi:MAG: short-chain dehydrogenase [Ignavibacteria bacterium]|nr:short-chain dehydrogenase [Ignavibacteria bacterium]
MDIKNKTILILGGWGLVGSAIARKIMEGSPKKVILTSLYKHEAEEICKDLNKEFKFKDKFVPFWGNIFTRYEFKDLNRNDLINDPIKRKKIVEDIVFELNDKILKESCIYKMLQMFKPDVIIDCINTATAIAYQNIYKAYYDVLSITQSKERDYDKLLSASEKLICLSYIPQLIRHIQILYNSMLKFKTKFYFKVGTSGTGGMGLNIPFTHSEEKPSRVLLSKSSVAGAHTLLLFLMARTPDGPMIKEIKPTAAIAWKKIQYGEIKKGNSPLYIYDVNPNDKIILKDKFELQIKKEFKKIGTLKTAFIDTGENGIFSRGEFEAITTKGQMEFVTPEEIAENVYLELQGGNTGNDVINALDSSVMEPSYRAGFMQHYAVEKLKELEKKYNTHSVAFEMLGPPRLSKLLYECHLLKLAYKNFDNVIKETPNSISKKLNEIITGNSKIRNEIVSIGVPILLPDGKSLIRGPFVIIPSNSTTKTLEITKSRINRWAYDGWVDLRIENCKLWRERFIQIKDQTEREYDASYSSKVVFTKDYWDNFNEINIGKIVGWIFINEEKGLRMKG